MITFSSDQIEAQAAKITGVLDAAHIEPAPLNALALIALGIMAARDLGVPAKAISFMTAHYYKDAPEQLRDGAAGLLPFDLPTQVH